MDGVKVHQFFPTEVYEFRKEQIDYTSEIEYLKTTQHFKQHDAQSSYGDLQNDVNLKHIFDFIHEKLEVIRQQYSFDCDKFEVISSWANASEANSGEHHTFHRHSMSYFSGVFYFTEGSVIGFEDPVIPRTMNQLEVLRTDGWTPFNFINPKPGKLIVFPSWLYHWTKPHYENHDRWNIAFNAFPTGKINYSLATDSTANITINR